MEFVAVDQWISLQTYLRLPLSSDCGLVPGIFLYRGSFSTKARRIKLRPSNNQENKAWYIFCRSSGLIKPDVAIGTGKVTVPDVSESWSSLSSWRLRGSRQSDIVGPDRSLGVQVKHWHPVVRVWIVRWKVGSLKR